MPKEIKILVDSREQKPWEFSIEENTKSGFITKITSSEVIKLDQGDYTVEGLEDKIIIERKSGLCELFVNYTPIENKKRLEAEFVRMQGIKHKYIVIESNLDADTMRMSLQQFKYPIPASKIVAWILELELKYQVTPIFAGNAGKKIARLLFDQAARLYL